MTPVRVVIVGGGVAGLSLAHRLAGRATVALLEAERFGAGASGAPAALLNPYRGRSARASELDVAGLAAMRSLDRELRSEGLDTGISFEGVLRLALSARQARHWRGRAGATWLEPESVPQGYHGPFGGLLVEGGGWLEPAKFLAALAAAATRRGADLRAGWRVLGLERSGQGWVVATNRGEVEGEVVVLCLGAEGLAATELPQLERVAGDILTLSPAPRLPYPLAGAVYGVRVGPSFLLGGNGRDPETPDPDAARRLQRSASHFIPALGEAQLEARWTGVRARRGDNRPLAAELEPGLWFFGALSGRGFLCAASLAASLASRWMA